MHSSVCWRRWQKGQTTPRHERRVSTGPGRVLHRVLGSAVGPAAVVSRMRSGIGIANPKIFVVGHNKTGTTSLAAALKQLGYAVGNQRKAERLIEDWGRRDFRRLVSYCHSADAFQDIPFSMEFTFQAMDVAFPGSKFILSVRDSPEQWLASRLRFDRKRLSLNREATADDLRQDPYVWPGWSYRVRELAFGQVAAETVTPDMLMARYVSHNARVQEYFRHRPLDLLTMNVGHSDALKQLCAFLGREYPGGEMPALNNS